MALNIQNSKVFTLCTVSLEATVLYPFLGSYSTSENQGGNQETGRKGIPETENALELRGEKKSPQDNGEGTSQNECGISGRAEYQYDWSSHKVPRDQGGGN